MLYTLAAVRDNLRNRDGKRVFYLGKNDQLTSEARDFLNRERISILPAEAARPQRYRLLGGGFMEEKPEHMTHLHGDVLVEKTHPRIAFRGAVDLLEAELLLGMQQMPQWSQALEEALTLVRQLLRCEVLEEPVPQTLLCGMDEQQLRSHSHRPQDYYGQPHFMPEVADGPVVLQLNRLRSLARWTELKAVAALPERTDILRALNRLSSLLYILMLRQKSGN